MKFAMNWFWRTWSKAARREKARQELIAVVERTRELLALEGNDFVHSGWDDREDALREWDLVTNRLRNNDRSVLGELSMFYTVTGPVQEVSFSGWGKEFLELAAKTDKLISKLK